MQDRSKTVRLVEVKRIPGNVTQQNDTVRVYRHSPERIQLQLRNPRWYANASLTVEDAREIINFLEAGIDDLTGGAR